MVVVALLLHVDFERNDHLENELHFKLYNFIMMVVIYNDPLLMNDRRNFSFFNYWSKKNLCPSEFQL